MGSTGSIDFRLWYAPGATVGLLQPVTEAAQEWVEDAVDLDDAQWIGDRLAIEHRYIIDIVNGIEDDGLTLERCA